MDVTTAGVYIALIAGATTICVYHIGMRAHKSVCNEELFNNLIGQINDNNECLLAKLDQVNLHCEQCNQRTLRVEALLVSVNDKLNDIYRWHDSTSDAVQLTSTDRHRAYLRR